MPRAIKISSCSRLVSLALRYLCCANIRVFVAVVYKVVIHKDHLKSKSKSKALPITGHEGPEGE